MKVFISRVAFALVALSGASASMGQTAGNPVIYADVPDVAIIRVGASFYMASTTMHLSPGLPIMKSQDLVNWTLVGYAYDRLGDNDALNLENGQSAYGRGSWAPSLRFHEGYYYASTFSSTTGRTHIYRTADIENGPWQAIEFAPSLHDHSLFFDDDGRAYMVYGAGEIRMVELESDLSGIRADGVDQIIIADASAVAGDNIMLPAEGSHLHKIDGRYYLFLITWPRGGMRTAIVYRAGQLTGPWEGRVAFQDQGVAQGGLIDTADGDWFAYLFQDRGSVGRIPYIVPVRWEDGWPILGNDGSLPDSLPLPADPDGLAGIVDSDEFDREPGDPALPLAWQWNHNPVPALWSVSERPGWLRLRTGRVDADFTAARNTLTQRTFGPVSSAQTAIDTANMRDGDLAGLGLLQRDYGFVGVRVDNGERRLVMFSAAGNSPREVESLQLDAAIVYLRADCDFTELRDRAAFYYSLDGRNWTAIGEPLPMQYTLPQHFMGYRFALFNFSTLTAGGFADFDYFRVDAAIAAVP